MDGQNNNLDRTSGHSELNPGEAVSLRSSGTATAQAATAAPVSSQVSSPLPPPADSPLRASVEPDQQAPAAVASPTTVSADPPADVPTGLQAPTTHQDYGPPPASADAPAVTSEEGISWTASEFIAHHKSTQWYAILAGGTLAFLVIVFLATRDWVTVAVILICAVLFGVSASRPPRQLQYGLDKDGIQVGQKSYPYEHFRSFSIFEEGPFSSLNFMPLKRFGPPLSIYYDPAHEDDIVDKLSQHLPLANHRRTVVEGLMHRIRF